MCHLECAANSLNFTRISSLEDGTHRLAGRARVTEPLTHLWGRGNARQCPVPTGEFGTLKSPVPIKYTIRVRFRPTAALWLSVPLTRADVALELSVATRAKAAALPPHSKLQWKTG